eukprot:215880-Amphidinium_carterae.1
MEPELSGDTLPSNPTTGRATPLSSKALKLRERGGSSEHMQICEVFVSGFVSGTGCVAKCMGEADCLVHHPLGITAQVVSCELSHSLTSHRAGHSCDV